MPLRKNISSVYLRDHISLIKHPLVGNSRTDVNVKRGASKGFRYEKLAIVERGSFIGENGWQGRGVMDFSCSLAFFLAFHPFFVATTLSPRRNNHLAISPCAHNRVDNVPNLPGQSRLVSQT